MKKEYPDRIEIDNIEFEKSQDEIYLELQSYLKKGDVEEFLEEKKELIEGRFWPSKRKSLAVREFNMLNVHSKWVKRAKDRKETISQLLRELEQDERVRFARPVYFRPDLKYPNGFTFDDQVIVTLEEKTRTRGLQNLFKELGAEVVEGPKGELGRNMMLLRLCDDKTQDIYEVAQKLAESKAIKSAGVNWIQLHSGFCTIPNDSQFSNQWNLLNIGQAMPDGNTATPGCDINIEPAWDISKGSPIVVIAVLDSGCDLDHEDLSFHYVQPERWYNAVTGSNDPNDYLGHGTCCAGIAAALTNSLTAQGVAGVGWHCRIMPIRIEFTEAGILSSLNWALNHHADIISMSWYWDGPNSNIDLKLQECFNADIVMVAASGNYAGALPDNIVYPARNPHVIAVGATNENDRRCTNLDWTNVWYYGSQYGPELSVVAPGVHVWSTDRKGVQGYDAGDYFEDFGGTSAATPHVAGLAGLILAYNPTLTPTQVRTIIENTADDQVGDPGEDTSGWDKYMGYGRINAYAAMLDVQTNHPFSPADVYIRNSLSDTGTEPYTGGSLCHSPDIIIRKHPVINPQAAFADMIIDPGSDNAEIGNDNYIYVRVHNEGPVASDIHVRVFFAPLNTTCGPDLWEYIGQIDFYNVPAGGDAVSDALVWENVPNPYPADHFCLIASIEGFGDPHPDPAGISNSLQYMDFIRNHNNICYRNITFEDVLPDTLFATNFFVGGIAGDTGKFDLRIEREQLALRAKIGLKLPHSLFKDTRAHLDNMIEPAEHAMKSFRYFELGKGRQSTIRNLTFSGTPNAACLEVKIPSDVKPGEKCILKVQQVLKGQSMGDFQIVGKVVDPQKTKYIAVRGTHMVHQADCEALEKTDRQLWVPFESLEDARSAGYDMALDCLNQPFTAKDVSFKLARKILHFVNSVELAEDLSQKVRDTLDIAYLEAQGKGYDIDFLDTARKILETRDEVGRFTTLEEIEAVEGVDLNEFINLVNAFKKSNW